MIGNIIRFIRNPRPALLWRLEKYAYLFKSDKLYLKLKFYLKKGHRLNLKNPVTFNEKLNWLKLYDHNPLYVNLVDKHLVKEWVESKIGAEYVIPTLGIWDRFDDIDIHTLPDSFVLKTTHGGGSIGVVVCKDKASFDNEKAKTQINKSLNISAYETSREWPYSGVKRKIIAEQYLEDNATHELRDYKFFCFDGKARYFKIDSNRFGKHYAFYYDQTGQALDLDEQLCPRNHSLAITPPPNISDMVAIAERLSEGLTFVRVDLYNCNSKIYFGEMTLYPDGGFGSFAPDTWDTTFGSLINLPL